MKKLIALFATTAVASGSAMGAIALSGTASVSYDDNGSSPSSTTYDADLVLVGTAGGTTYTQSMDIDGGTGRAVAVTGSSLATTIGPITITADMFDEDDSATVSSTGGLSVDSGDNRSVTVSLDAPVGDATIGLDDSGDVTVSGTFSGVTVSHTMQDGADTTTGSASIAGMDITLSNDAGSSSWTIGTTVAGTAITVGSDKSISATFGVTGNTVVVTHTAERASSSSTTSTKYSTAQKDAYTTIAVSRDLTSGAALSATYNTFDSSLTLKVLDKTNSQGVDLIIDQLSGYTVNQNMLATKIKGNIVNVGRLAGGPSEFNCDIHALRRINYKGVTFRTRSLDEIRKVFKDMWKDLSNVVSNGTLSMPIEKVFDFKDVSSAFAHMRDNKHFGKLILKL